jgi:signal transduction histidine kinase
MELLLDFRRQAVDAGPEHPGAGRVDLPEPARGLVACYQAFLGHELPNQLVPIQALARLLREGHDRELSEEGRLLLDRLAALARRADEQARLLAEVGRLCREGPGGPPVDLADAAREAGAEVRTALAREAPGGPSLTIRVVEPLPDLAVTHRALHAVLVQLLRQAARPGSTGGSRCVEVGGSDQGPGPSFWVRDDGPAWDPKSLAALREPEATEPGLFLVRQLVAHWGGALQVCDNGGKVTCTVLLPPPRRAPGGPRP